MSTRDRGTSRGVGCLAAVCLIVGSAGCGRVLYDPVEDLAVQDGGGPGGDALFGDGSIPGTCGAGISYESPFNGHCYTLVLTPESWDAASLACVARGGGTHLATITDFFESSFTTSLSPGTLDDLWLGASDTGIEGTWEWITGEPMPFANWRSGEPNDIPTPSDCMVLEVDNSGTWDDQPCENLYPYVCERSP